MKVYRYWAQPVDKDNAHLALEQLGRAAEYRRELAKIENRSRLLRRAVLGIGDKAARVPFNTMISTAEKAARKAARLRARAAAGPRLPCAWGTCGVVDDAADQSQRTTKIFDDVTEYHPFDEGLLAVQFQQHASHPSWKPVLASDLVGGEGQFVRLGGELIGKPKRQGGTGAKRLRELWFRIGTAADKTPIWVRFYTLLHRSLPAARTTWVKLSCRRTGVTHRWFLIVVVDEDNRVPVAPTGRAAMVGIDIGWRKMPAGPAGSDKKINSDGIRIAYWVGSDGAEGELVIPESVVGRRSKSDSLRAIRDRERNTTSENWRKWIHDHLPELHPVREAARAMALWLKIPKFIRLFRLWKEHRVSGDETMFAAVDTWLAHDRHLFEWEAHNRRRQAMQIGGRVEQLAVYLSKRYEAVAVERRGMVPKLVAEGATNQEEWQRALNAKRVSISSPGQVRAQLERFALKYQAKYIEEDPKNTTRECRNCQHLRDNSEQLEIACPACGLAEDQDRTAAINIMRRASERLRLDADEATASGKVSKKLGARRNRRAAKKDVIETPAVTG